MAAPLSRGTRSRMKITKSRAILGALLVLSPILLSPILPPRSAHAQAAIAPPARWSVQEKAKGARVFTPPDLQPGEVYSVAIYPSAPLEGKTLEEYLRAFAGPPSKQPGRLSAPLKIETKEGRIVSGVGVYGGPDGVALGVMFVGVTLDGGRNIHVSRTLFSAQGGLLGRYSAANEALMSALVERAKAEAGSNIHFTPSEVLKKLTPGGELTPGIYEGIQNHGQELVRRIHVHIYPYGEWRLTDQNDEDLVDRWGDAKAGEFSYNRITGALSLDWTVGLGNRGGSDQFCYFGRDAAGKPAIYAEDNVGYETYVSLSYIGPPDKRLSKAQQRELEAKAAEEKNRFKWTTPPGKGVPSDNVAAVLLDSKFNGQSTDESVYLLLKDGTVYADLPVPPDELDIIRSRQKEPDKWGKWRKTAAGYTVSWAGAPFQDLPGAQVLAAPAQVKLEGRWGTGTSSGVIGFSSSYALWGVTFTKGGRFRKDRRGGSSSSMGFGDTATHVNSGYDDNGSYVGASGPSFVMSSEQKKKNPNGNREGDYSINGWVLTLRYDNGDVARLPFFFLDASRKVLWFDGSSMSLDEDKK